MKENSNNILHVRGVITILFPETGTMARARAGTHASKFTCAIYHLRFVVIIYFS